MGPLSTKILRNIFLCYSGFLVPFGAKSLASEPDKITEAELMKEWQRFTLDPHPMGSQAQQKYSEHLRSQLKKHSKVTELQEFDVAHPQTKKKLKGRNVISVHEGTENCWLLIGGHYDTKEFSKERFVGANDGGSSTVLKIALNKILGEAARSKKPFPAKSWGACKVEMVFFDGEEAFLKEWTDGEKLFGVQDNLYGSRKYVEEKLTKGKPDLLLLLDMIGHKDQKLFVTSGSHPIATQALLKNKGDVDIKAVELGIEDDHIPFAQKGVPFVHVIDWTNLKEWHTPADDLKIVSAAKLNNALKMVWGFLSEPRT